MKNNVRPGRYNTDGIVARLEKRGFIHESDLKWLEKRARALRMQADDGADAMTSEAIKILDALAACLAPCTGEAHRNAFIDHCGLCAPRWGRVVNRDKVKPNPLIRQLRKWRAVK